MNLKGILGLSTSLMMVCAGLISSSAYAEDYVKQSQVNVANGVAGLNGSKQVTADINNNKIITDGVQLNKKNDRLRFITNSPDGNNQAIDMFYNYGASNKDDLGNLLTANTFYFTNNRYGNNYLFNGDVTARQLTTTGDLKAKYFYLGSEAISPYQPANASLVFLSYYGYDNVNVRPNTLMLGGRTVNSQVGIKASCQNTSGGDLGGSCYQFTDMGGAQTYHRSGAGGTDGINMDMRSSSNSPLDSVGGNKLDHNSNDGSYSLVGNSYPIFENVKAGSNSFKVKGAIGCGVGGGTSRCEMSGIGVLDNNSQDVDVVKVKAGRYDPKSDTTTVTLPSNYTLKSDLSSSDNVVITFYSADGVAYGIKFDQATDGSQYVVIYPALTPEEKGLLQDRMAIWTNISNGMASKEGGTSVDASNVDMPNYYYGYNAGAGAHVINKDLDTQLNAELKVIANDTTTTQAEKDQLTKKKNQEIRNNQYTTLSIQTYYYPNAPEDHNRWRTIRDSNQKDTPSFGSPLANDGDQYDYKWSCRKFKI